MVLLATNSITSEASIIVAFVQVSVEHQKMMTHPRWWWCWLPPTSRGTSMRLLEDGWRRGSTSLCLQVQSFFANLLRDLINWKISSDWSCCGLLWPVSFTVQQKRDNATTKAQTDRLYINGSLMWGHIGVIPVWVITTGHWRQTSGIDPIGMGVFGQVDLSSGIHINVRILGFPAEYCSVVR